MKTIEKVEIKKLSFPVGNIYNYHAMIFRSVDNGKTFAYCGCGKYFATFEEAEAYKAEIETAARRSVGTATPAPMRQGTQ